MSRTNHLGVYVSDAERNRIEREAEQADLSISGYIMSLVEAHWDSDDTADAADRMNAEEKIERLVDKATQELEASARHTEQRVDELADMMARSGSYSVANFELLKYQHSPPEGTKTDALRVGSRPCRRGSRGYRLAVRSAPIAAFACCGLRARHGGGKGRWR